MHDPTNWLIGIAALVGVGMAISLWVNRKLIEAQRELIETQRDVIAGLELRLAGEE